jgi:transposase
LALPAEAARREKPNFVPIVAEAAPGISIGGGVEPSPASDRGSKAGSHHPIEIRLAGALIRVAPGADHTLLTEVLRALRASAT